MLINDLVSRMEREGRPPVRLTPAAIDSLGRYDWPGNVRELSNLVERLAILYPNGVVDDKICLRSTKSMIDLERSTQSKH